MPHRAMPILDTKTEREYQSKASAGRDIAPEFGLDPTDQHAWYDVVAAAEPDRFLTKNPAGEWVPLDDPWYLRLTRPGETEAGRHGRRARPLRRRGGRPASARGLTVGLPLATFLRLGQSGLLDQTGLRPAMVMA